MFINHIYCCFWFFQAKLLDFPNDCWVVVKGFQDDTPGRQYLVSYYWAFQTLTTVGYGDISAESTVEKLMACLWMIFGVGFYSYTIGNMTQIVQSLDDES